MACCPRPRTGYATAAAVVIATGLAALAAAVTAAALADLRTEQAWARRDRDQRRLDSAQAAALEALLVQGGDGRLLWRTEIGGMTVQILAEPEGAKRSAASVAGPEDRPPSLALSAPDRWFAQLVESPSRGLFSLAQADPSEDWRRCGLSLVSPYGRAEAWQEPSPTQTPKPAAFNRRAGQVWRVRAVQADGVAEDRVWRFTGKPGALTYLIERRRQTGQALGDPCATSEAAS